MYAIVAMIHSVWISGTKGLFANAAGVCGPYRKNRLGNPEVVMPRNVLVFRPFAIERFVL